MAASRRIRILVCSWFETAQARFLTMRRDARGIDGMARYEDLPYRTCVGMMLINAAGLVFIGRRAGGIEHVDESHVWQMPQGGVDQIGRAHV